MTSFDCKKIIVWERPLRRTLVKVHLYAKKIVLLPTRSNFPAIRRTHSNMFELTVITPNSSGSHTLSEKELLENLWGCKCSFNHSRSILIHYSLELNYRATIGTIANRNIGHISDNCKMHRFEK